MKPVLTKFFSRATDLADSEPVLALFLGAALLGVLLSALFPHTPTAESGGRPGLAWTLYQHSRRLIWAVLLVVFVLGGIGVLQNYLRQTLAKFQRTHGRITTANYNAVQTIWGAEQQQGELRVALYNDEEETERIESEDLTRPAVLRKRTVRRFASGNPFLSARHDVTLRQNPRRKGSAVYGGYETECRFSWRLRNPADAAFQCDLIFPLPALGAVYHDLSATLNGRDVLPRMEIKQGELVLTRVAQPNESMDFDLAFKSRGMSHWYFQVREAREIRDFTLALNLPDLPPDRLNYPEGCMTPTAIQPAANGQGCTLTYRLDHALSNKGLGVALPQLEQPGATTQAVLRETERAWLLGFAALTLGFTLASLPHAVVLALVFGAAAAFVYGLLGDLSDLLAGFWKTAALVVLPLFLCLAALLTRVAKGSPGRLFAAQWILFGVAYPGAAGLDTERQTLYLNLCAAAFLALAGWMLVRRLQPRGPRDAARGL